MACKRDYYHYHDGQIPTLYHRFRWVFCQIGNVLRCYSNDIQGALDDLPEGLDEIYERTLRDIDKPKRKYAQRLFQCLSVSIRPLRVEELAEIFAVQLGATVATLPAKDLRPHSMEWAVLSACSSLIITIDQGDSRVVQFAHLSVKEFLTSERLAQAEDHLSFFHILLEPAHALIARASLSVLLQFDDNIDRDTIGRFPLAPYAARHWVEHAQFRDVSSHIKELMECLFDPERPHFAAWVWLYDIDRYWTKPMSTINPTQPEAVPLYHASLCGFRGLVEHLINTDSGQVNIRGGSHTTPLHAASVKGHLEVASLLLESGADPNSRDYLSRVPLHRVSQGGQFVIVESSLEIARLLVDCGAKPNVTDDEGDTPLHGAARSGYRDIAELLVESGASLDVRNKNQETPLHVACRNGKLDVLRFLIDRGSDINSLNRNGFIPLHSASRFGHVEAARQLLDSGSDVNARSSSYQTALHYALRYGHLDLARLLINRGADVNAREINHWTPLRYASRNGYLDLARLLIDRGADVNAQADRHTPMHSASCFVHLDIVKSLVEHGADVDSRSNEEKTPLDYASMSGFLDIARFLIERGAAVSVRDNQGWTPFHTVSACGHLHIVKFLLECGVDVNIRNGNGETSLHLASGRG